MLWPSYDQTLIQCCRQGFCTWNHVFWCFIFLTKVLKLRTWALEPRMYHCCWWRMAFLRALSASPALCSPSLSTTVVFWISSFDAYQMLCHSMRDEGSASLGTPPSPHPMVMGLHSSAPVPPPPPVVWVVVGGGGDGRSCICMYMNVYVWYECIFLVFVYDYDMIMIWYVYDSVYVYAYVNVYEYVCVYVTT